MNCISGFSLGVPISWLDASRVGSPTWVDRLERRLRFSQSVTESTQTRFGIFCPKLPIWEPRRASSASNQIKKDVRVVSFMNSEIWFSNIPEVALPQVCDHSEQHGTSLRWADMIFIFPSSPQLGNFAEPAQQLGKMMEDGTLKSKSTHPRSQIRWDTLCGKSRWYRISDSKGLKQETAAWWTVS